jgi:outer membrane protein assembly factor BamA
MGQSLGRIFSKGDIEVGATLRSFKRDFNDPEYPSANWGTLAFFVKYGFYDWLTCSVEGSSFASPDKQYPERDYKDSHAGLGVGVMVLADRNMSIALGLHYDQTYNHDRSPSEYDKFEQSFYAGTEFCKTFYMTSVEISTFIVPAFVWDEVTQTPPGVTFRDVSINNFGLATGVDFLIFSHIQFTAQVVYANYWQPRYNIGYVF